MHARVYLEQFVVIWYLCAFKNNPSMSYVEWKMKENWPLLRTIPTFRFCMSFEYIVLKRQQIGNGVSYKLKVDQFVTNVHMIECTCVPFIGGNLVAMCSRKEALYELPSMKKCEKNMFQLETILTFRFSTRNFLPPNNIYTLLLLGKKPPTMLVLD